MKAVHVLRFQASFLILFFAAGTRSRSALTYAFALTFQLALAYYCITKI